MPNNMVLVSCGEAEKKKEVKDSIGEKDSTNAKKQAKNAAETERQFEHEAKNFEDVNSNNQVENEETAV